MSLVAFLGVAAIALHSIGVTRSALGIAEQKDADPFNAALGDAHPLTTWSRAIADIAFPSSLCPARPLDIDLMSARMCRVAAFRRTLLPALTFRRTTYAGLRSR
jgi:hypothetical protein